MSLVLACIFNLLIDVCFDIAQLTEVSVRLSIRSSVLGTVREVLKPLIISSTVLSRVPCVSVFCM